MLFDKESESYVAVAVFDDESIVSRLLELVGSSVAMLSYEDSVRDVAEAISDGNDCAPVDSGCPFSTEPVSIAEDVPS